MFVPLYAILLSSLTSVSIFSVCCYSSVSISVAMTQEDCTLYIACSQADYTGHTFQQICRRTVHSKNTHIMYAEGLYRACKLYTEGRSTTSLPYQYFLQGPDHELKSIYDIALVMLSLICSCVHFSGLWISGCGPWRTKIHHWQQSLYTRIRNLLRMKESVYSYSRTSLVYSIELVKAREAT